MTRKQKYRNTTQNKLKPEVIMSILGLLFGYLEYFLDLRPKLVTIGLYELGFIDCLVIVLSTLLSIWVLKDCSNKGKKAKK